MSELVLSVVGLAFAAWALIRPAAREMARAKLKDKKAACNTIAFILLFWLIAYPFVQALISVSSCYLLVFTPAVGHFITVILVTIEVWLVWPFGKWCERLLQKFDERQENLILTGRADVVVDVFHQAAPEMHRRQKNTVNPNKGDSDSYDRCYDAMLENALVHTEFIRSISNHNRVFLAKLLSHQSMATFYMSDDILTELMFGDGRIILRELQQTFNYDRENRSHAYRIPDRCVILHALFDDIELANQLACWKPVGDGVIRLIASRSRLGAEDTDQMPLVVEIEKARLDSPIGGSIWFFQLMATSAVKQGTDSHVWIYYLSYFVSQIEKIVDIPEQSLSDEYPNAYCRWIYECLSCCDEVIRVVSQIAESNPLKPATDDAGQHGVVVGALETYGRCLATIFKSRRLPEAFKYNCGEGLCIDFQAWGGEGFPSVMQAFAIKYLVGTLSNEDKVSIANYIERVVGHNPHREAYRELHEMLQDT